MLKIIQLQSEIVCVGQFSEYEYTDNANVKSISLLHSPHVLHQINISCIRLFSSMLRDILMH